MRLVLRDDVTGVGHRGDIVDVSGGYARNFLLPSGRAIVATKGIETQAGSMRRARDLRVARDREAAETQARVLAGATLTVSARAGSTGRLFGSVSSADVAEAALQQLGVDLDRQHVVLPEPIKEVGSREVTVELHRDVVTVVTVEVVGGRLSPARGLSQYPPAPWGHGPRAQWIRSSPSGLRPSTACPQRCSPERQENPQLSSLPSHRPFRSNVGAPWFRPLTKAGPVPFGQRGRCRGYPPTTSRPRSRCSAPCCCRATPSLGRHRDLRPGGLLQAGPRPHLRRRPEPLRAGASRSTPSPSPTSSGGQALLEAIGRPLGAGLAAGEHPVDRPTPPTTPASSRSTPCCAGWSGWPARSPRSATASPRT